MSVRITLKLEISRDRAAFYPRSSFGLFSVFFFLILCIPLIKYNEERHGNLFCGNCGHFPGFHNLHLLSAADWEKKCILRMNLPSGGLD